MRTALSYGAMLFALSLFSIFRSTQAGAQFPGPAFWKKHAAGDPCAGQSAGGTCTGGAKYVGTFNGYKYMTTPGGCTDSATPVCSGSADTLKKSWGTQPLNHGTTSTTDGAGNTATLAAGWANTYAAKYCQDLDYGGFTDWFLPAKDELNFLWTNRAAVGGFMTATDVYYSSTQYDTSYAWGQLWTNGLQANTPKSSGAGSYWLRCMRKY